MNDEVVIVVAWDAYRTTENGLPSHRYTRAKRIKDARVCAFRAWRYAGEPRFAETVRLDVTIRRGKALDEFNLPGALKPLIDGICVGRVDRRTMMLSGVRRTVEFRDPGMLPDDNPRWLQMGTVTQETGARWKGREEIEFRFTATGQVPAPKKGARRGREQQD